MFQALFNLDPKKPIFFKGTNMFFQVSIFEIKSNFHVISLQKGHKH